MPKSTTAWTPYSATGETTLRGGGSLLLEDGFNLLLEDGFELLLESSVYTPKAATTWEAETKNATSWYDRGFGEFLTGQSVARTEEDGTARLMEDGTARTTEDGTIVDKAETAWTEDYN